MSHSFRYQFNWGLLGNIEEGRPNLGNTTRLEVYRLMQFTFRDILERNYGTAEANRIFYAAGELAGKEFFLHYLNDTANLDDFIHQLAQQLTEMNIGILRVEKADIANGIFVATLSEDLDCSGLPDLDYEICAYDEGFLAGLLNEYTGLHFSVKEIDCWCTGDRTCRFSATLTAG